MEEEYLEVNLMRKKMHKWWWSWEHEKEEEWLNQMARKGWSLISVGFCTYEFEECHPGEYVYRIELLENNYNSQEGQDYISFVESTGAILVGNYINWVYFKKKKSEGTFDLFSDLDSKIKHYKRIYSMMMPIGLVNAYIGFNNIYLYTRSGFNGSLIGLVNIGCALLLLVGSYKVNKKIKQLKSEKQIYE